MVARFDACFLVCLMCVALLCDQCSVFLIVEGLQVFWAGLAFL